MNPGQSVKDRAALAIIRDAERAVARCAPAASSSRVRRGNTGIGLSLVGNCTGLSHRDRDPENTQSQEKKDMLRLAGPSSSRSPPSPTPIPTIT